MGSGGSQKGGGGERGGGEGGRKGEKGGWGWDWVNVKILDNLLSIFTLYISKCINIAIKQIYKLCISV